MNLGPRPQLSDFVEIVQGFDYSMSNINLGVLASDKWGFTDIANYIKQIPGDKMKFFSQIHVILREKDVGLAQENHMDDNAEGGRRRLIARLRNYILYSILQDEDTVISVLWINSDMIREPYDLLHRIAYSVKDVTTTAARFGPGGGFVDLNTWVGERIKPNGDEQAVIEQGGDLWPSSLSIKYTHQLEEEFGQLECVKGTVPFVRGEFHREGIAFTTNYVIGVGWKHEDYDDIEFEDINVAGFLGYKCWGMPHAMTEHSQD
ncbi:hypothetical protein BGZ93_000483 [Podila epicladia]|nr:hypothetical protein BGZ92_003832 [Podila epicladia]KAG0085743.1 hypothetical protein BGZ93_000483 [Podila epicladia]